MYVWPFFKIMLERVKRIELAFLISLYKRSSIYFHVALNLCSLVALVEALVALVDFPGSFS